MSPVTAHTLEGFLTLKYSSLKLVIIVILIILSDTKDKFCMQWVLGKMVLEIQVIITLFEEQSIVCDSGLGLWTFFMGGGERRGGECHYLAAHV